VVAVGKTVTDYIFFTLYKGHKFYDLRPLFLSYSFRIYSLLPVELDGYDSLVELALDLRWSWNHAADEIWRQLAPALFQKVGGVLGAVLIPPFSDKQHKRQRYLLLGILLGAALITQMKDPGIDFATPNFRLFF